MRHDRERRTSQWSAALATLRASTLVVAMVVALAHALAQDANFAAPPTGAGQPAGSPGQAVSQPSSAGVQTQNVAEPLLKGFYQVDASATALASGEPLSLQRALYGVYNQNERLRRLLAYWNFSYTHAYLNLCATYQADVKSCVNKLVQKYGSSAPSETNELLNAMLKIAEEKCADARLGFMQAQYNFDAAFTTPMGRRAAIARANAAGKRVGEGDAILYVPSTAPSTASYNTRASELAQARRLTPEAMRLSSQIPLLYETLQKRASQAARFRAILEKEFGAANVDDDALFKALDDDFNAKVETLKAAARYNQAIAAYAAQTVPITIQGAEFLATLNLRETAPANGAANPTNNAAPANRQPTTTFFWSLPGLTPYSNYAYEEGFEAGYAAAKPLDANLLANSDASSIALSAPTYALSSLAFSSSYAAPTLQTVGYQSPATPKLDGANATLTATNQTLPEPAPQPQPAQVQEQPQVPQPAPAPTPAPAKQEPQPAQVAQPQAEPAATTPHAQEENKAQPTTTTEEKKVETPTQEPPKPQPAKEQPKEEPISAQNDWPVPFEFANRDLDDVDFPIIVLVTGYEQPHGAQNANSRDQNAPDGAFLFNLNFELVASVREFLDSLCDEVYELARIREEDAGQGWIIRGQEASGSTNDAAENERLVARRAQEIGRALFAVPIVANAQTPGEEERLFSLQEVTLRARAVTPDARVRIANEYWRLFAATAKLRVEETMLQTYASLYEKASGAAREERALAVALEAQARVAEARAEKRLVQNNLMRAMALTQQSSAFPLPSTQPFCGVKFNLGVPPYPNIETRRVGALIQERLKVMQTLGGSYRSAAELLNIDLTNITDDNFAVAAAALEKKRERALFFIEQIKLLNFAITEYVANYPGYVSNDQFVEAIVGR